MLETLVFSLHYTLGVTRDNVGLRLYKKVKVLPNQEVCTSYYLLRVSP